MEASDQGAGDMFLGLNETELDRLSARLGRGAQRLRDHGERAAAADLSEAAEDMGAEWWTKVRGRRR
jgi:hypothetical protein